MLDRLDRIKDRTAYLIAALGLGGSLLAAALVPPEKTLEGWIKFVIWHGMLKWACIVTICFVAVLAIAYLFTKRERLYEWARALQVVFLPSWVLGVFIGAIAARITWNSWQLSEPRMIMSLVVTAVAAAALMLSLFWQRRWIGAIGQILTALAMGVGLWWISAIPASENVHPVSAVASSPDVVFQICAAAMMAGCLIAIVALAVPVRHWLIRAEAPEEKR